MDFTVAPLPVQALGQRQQQTALLLMRFGQRLRVRLERHFFGAEATGDWLDQFLQITSTLAF